MQQLSGTDNVMLFGERRNIHNHVAALLVYDVTTAPSGKVRFKDILRHFDARMHLHPLFRRRLVTRSVRPGSAVLGSGCRRRR